jgi:hypothetical protein
VGLADRISPSIAAAFDFVQLGKERRSGMEGVIEMLRRNRPINTAESSRDERQFSSAFLPGFLMLINGQCNAPG